MKYVDSENYDNIVIDAVESAIASFKVDGINISEKEKQEIEKKLINNENVKILLKKKRCDSNGR